MYVEFIGNPTDKDLEKYPSVHLPSPHEWDPSVLDYVDPDGNGEASWTTDQNDRSQFDSNMLIELYKFLTYLMMHPRLHQLITCVPTNMLSHIHLLIMRN